MKLIRQSDFELVSTVTCKTFRIGDGVRVKLIGANVQLRQLGFELVSGVPDKDLIAQI